MASLLRRTTLADERRALRAQSQQRTAPRVHEETYDSSSDEEDPEPFHRQQQQQYDDDNDAPMTTVVSDLKKENGKKDDDDEKAKLEKLYEEKLKKKARRSKQTLKAPTLIDPETGLGRLLHKQPQLSKPNSTTACAAYTRKLFGHYHAAVREWTAGQANTMNKNNDTTWMHQVEKLSSQKVVRDHVESLRQVICRQFVEQQVGLEKSDGWFDELMQEREQMLEPAASPERHEAPSSSPARVSPPQHSHNDNEHEQQDESSLALQDSPRPKRGFPDATTAAQGSNNNQPPLKRRVVQDDESDDEELEFESPPALASTTLLASKPASKRRVLDDESDEEEEAELEIDSPKQQPDKDVANEYEDMKDGEAPETKPAENTEKRAEEAAATNDEEAEEKIFPTVKTPEKDDEGVAAPPSDSDDVGPTDSNDETLEAGDDEKDIGDDTGADSASQDVTGQEEPSTSNASSPEKSRGSSSVSPEANSPYRLQVLEELTQGSSTNVGMNLGQESQPFATQPSQDERLFETFSSTQDSFHLDLSARENTETSTATAASLPPEDETAVAASPPGSPSDKDTIVPSDSLPPEDETVIPSLSETQATLIPSETQEIPTQLASASSQSNDE